MTAWSSLPFAMERPSGAALLQEGGANAGDAWIRIDLSRQQMEEGALSRIREECCRWYLAARTPAGARMLSCAPDVRRQGSVSAELYFSPAMAYVCREALASYHPVAATGSPSGRVTLLVGDA